MPRLNDTENNLEQHQARLGSYGFSATRMEDLGASEYTLVTIAVDTSSSVSYFEKEMKDCLKEIVKSCQHSPRADNLMIRVTEFNSHLNELHGFKLLQECNLDDYNDILNVGGMTALYDASENAISSTGSYGKKLMENDFQVNGIVFVITDGDDNHSSLTPGIVKKAFSQVYKEESLESLISILIGVNIQEPYISDRLASFNTEVGFNKYIELGNASASTLAKLAEFVSKSISSQSQSLGTGGASKDLLDGSLTI